MAHKIAGRLPWQSLFEPVINLCKNGFAVSPVLAESIRSYENQIKQNVGLKNIFTNPVNGQLYKTNEIIKLPGLAKTLEMISVNGSQVFYDGALSAQIVSENNANGKFARDIRDIKSR
jgi:gamma-glutamyltranspeptidase